MEGRVGRSLVVSAEIAKGAGGCRGESGSEEEEGGRFERRVRGSELRRIEGLVGTWEMRRWDCRKGIMDGFVE